MTHDDSDYDLAFGPSRPRVWGQDQWAFATTLSFWLRF